MLVLEPLLRSQTGQNAIRAYAELDAPNTVAESNETNNKCQIEFTAIVKAGK
jgi:hypothetical protein